MPSLTPAQTIALAAIVLIVLAGAGLRLAATSAPPPDEQVAYQPPPGTEPELQVHVVGAVVRPGVYRLPVGARVQDAVNAAGGFAANARPDSLNLAAFLDDGQQVVVQAQPPPAAPAPPELASTPPPTAYQVGASAAAPSVATQPASPRQTPVNAGTPADSAMIPQTTSPGAPRPVAINTAGLEELESLPGIGENLAMRILYYRHEHGGFRSLEELRQVPGIGDATFEKLRPYITLQ